jgi:hypothetical protein
MKLLPGDIILIHRGTGWMIFAPFVWLWQWAVGPYHVEMVWRTTDDGYMAFSLQPPVLDIVHRKFSDLHITAYRLKNRPSDLDDEFWRWGNSKILHTLYVLGWSTCGHPPKDFYDLDCSPYPWPIEKYLKKPGRFKEVR